MNLEVGPANWQDEYQMGEGGKVSCRIGIFVEDRGWVWKGDGAGATDIEGDKGSFSDAFKRAAVKWGIARDLYDEKAAPAPVAAVTQEPAQEAAPAAPQAEGVGLCPTHGTPWRTTKGDNSPAKRAYCSQPGPNGARYCVEQGPWLSPKK